MNVPFLDGLIDFVSANGIVIAVTLILGLVMWANARPRNVSSLAANILGAVLIVLFIRIMWALGTAPKDMADFIKADFLQAIATLLTACATTALWLVTRGLTRVTRVQVHAATAPLVSSIIYLRHDPTTTAGEEQLFLPPYTFANEDLAIPELNAFHGEYEAAFAMFTSERDTWQAQQTSGATPRSPAPQPPSRRYIVVALYNAQAASAYGFATDITINTSLAFPRYATVRGASGQTQPAPDQFYLQERSLKVPQLFGQGQFAVAAFRVDGIPQWRFEIRSITYQDYLGKSCTFAVGMQAAQFGTGTFVTETGRWAALKGEQPT